MLTQDENIVDIRFAVQYRLKDARAFLFENRDPEEAVMQAAEIGGARDRRQEQDGLGAVRAARRDRRRRCVKSMQSQLDRSRPAS